MKFFDKYGNELDYSGKLSKTYRPNTKAIIEKIVNQFKDKSRKDIQKWRTAIQVAQNPEMPRRDILMDLYEDLSTDGHLSSQIRLRKDATLNTDFQIINKTTGDVDVEKTAFFNASWFYDFIEYVLESELYGFSIIEFTAFSDKPELGIVPRRNVLPELKQVIPDLSNPNTTISYAEDYFKNWLIEVLSKKPLGILNDIVPNLIWKRNAMQSWAEFCERFGIPLTTATTLKQDDETLDLIESMLQQLGEAAYGVFPEGTTLEIKEANRQDAYQVFDNMVKRNDEEISKALVGGTMLSDNGSSRSQSEVHERNLIERIAVSDRRKITFIVNDYLIPLLQNQGYSFSENDVFAFDVTQEISITEHWKIVRDAMQTYEIDQDWLSKRFNIPITGKKKILTPTAKTDNSPLAIIPETVNLPKYQAAACCEKHNVWQPDAAYMDEMDKITKEIIGAVWKKRNTLTSEAKRTVLEYLRLYNGLRKGWGTRYNELKYNEPDHLMLAMMELNLLEFSASKTEAFLASLNQLLIDKDKLNIRSFTDFKREAFKVSEAFNVRYLQTEYNLSVAVGQNSAAYARAWAEKDVIPYVQYITAGDQRVRDTHQLLNNRIFRINDEEARRLWPPNGYGCRCEMIQYPYKPDKTAVTTGTQGIALIGGDKFKKTPFYINRGDVKEVFTGDQYYHSIKGLPDKIKSLNYTDYKLAPYKDFKQFLKPIKIDTSITPENVKELFRIDGNISKNTSFMGFKDYRKRSIILKENIFKTHTTGKYISKDEIRHQLFPYVETVLKSPDEVWITDKNVKNIQVVYVKYFQDMALVVPVKIGKTNFEIQTWFMMKNEKEVRKGYLVRRKE